SSFLIRSFLIRGDLHFEGFLHCGRPVFNSWAGKIPWRRKWQPNPVFLPGESHGQRSLVGCSLWNRKSWTQLSTIFFFLFLNILKGLLWLLGRGVVPGFQGLKDSHATKHLFPCLVQRDHLINTSPYVFLLLELMGGGGGGRAPSPGPRAIFLARVFSLLCPWRGPHPTALGGMFRNTTAICLHLVGPLRGKKSGASLTRCLHQTLTMAKRLQARRLDGIDHKPMVSQAATG
uniref:Uncharacterized protein n=1 Tax=Bos indicus x Bos taurus TaxID=30522 RepID=A0A4W2HA23_BOBOX